MSQNDRNDKQRGLSWSAPKTVQPASMPATAPKPAPKARVSYSASVSQGATAKVVGWLAVGVVAGVVIAWAGTATLRPGSSTAGPLQNAGAANIATSTLGVPSPQKAGMEVMVARAEVSAPTWITVYETRDGKPGNVLGAALFAAGQSSGTVDLLRGTVAGQTYLVAERSDNGDHRFSLKDDALILGADAQPVWASFTAN